MKGDDFEKRGRLAGANHQSSPGPKKEVLVLGRKETGTQHDLFIVSNGGK
jgi:hypothetical protein